LQTYRVYGDKLVSYYVDVQAISEDEAYEIANGLDSSNWFQVEQDDVIAPHTVELQENLVNN
jgi:hypothetical protein